jgi:hypothetical protein
MARGTSGARSLAHGGYLFAGAHRMGNATHSSFKLEAIMSAAERGGGTCSSVFRPQPPPVKVRCRDAYNSATDRLHYRAAGSARSSCWRCQYGHEMTLTFNMGVPPQKKRRRGGFGFRFKRMVPGMGTPTARRRGN